jgi:uncharacterized protein
MNTEQVIQQTKNWIQDVVIGCNFCPFASKVFLGTKLRYVVVPNATDEKALEVLMQEFQHLDAHKETETTLLIFPEVYAKFYDFLDLIEEAEDLLEDEDYEGEYQVAHFHPLYLFGGVVEDDASHYTNRSPYPMLHILREDSVTKVSQAFKEVKDIPKRNITFSRDKGTEYMQALLANAMTRKA